MCNESPLGIFFGCVANTFSFMQVTKVIDGHMCSSSSRIKSSMASRSWVADKAITILKNTPNVGAKQLQKQLQDDYKVTIGYDTVWQGREIAVNNLYGNWEESFQRLYNFKAEVELRSPGSIVEIDTINVRGNVHFNRFFCAFRPCIEGFVVGCRPYISIDSTALNGKWNGQLCAVTALDGHNWMYPVAFGFIQVENTENWTWFMLQLKKAIGNIPILAVCSDACKGLENAVVEVFPQAEQRECFRHLMQNFMKKFHGEACEHMWPAARAYKYDIFYHHFQKVISASPQVHGYLTKYHSLLWMRYKFNPAIKCDYINNNLAESFNSWIKDIKDLPVDELADKLRVMIMELFDKRRKIGDRLQGTILPAVIHQLNGNTRGLGHLKVRVSNTFNAEVTDSRSEQDRHVVKTHIHECTCLEWQHTGKPCPHALAFLTTQQNINMEDYVHEYYSLQKFRAAYEGAIEPMTGKAQWPRVELGFTVLPPIAKRSAGRRRKQRIKNCFEKGVKVTRIQNKNKCKRCGELGHRQAGCPLNGTKKRLIQTNL